MLQIRLRKNSSLFVIGFLGLVLMLNGCSKRDFVGIKPNTESPTFTVTQAVQDQYIGKIVVVKGDVQRVCQDEGCWFNITDGLNTLRINFSSSGVTVPISLTGTVLVEGQIQSSFLTQDEAKGLHMTIGSDQNLIDTISGETRVTVLSATGVTFLGDY